MGLKLAVRTRIVVNSKEYHGVDEMPADVRAAYEKAMGSGALARAVAAGSNTTGTRAPAASLIIFNGRQYDSPEAMPPEVRRLYDAALASVSGGSAPQGASAAPSPALPREAPDLAIEPGGASRWSIVAFLGGVAALIVWYLLRNRG